MTTLTATAHRTVIDLERLVAVAALGLVVAAGLEFILLRLFTRTAIHLPNVQELSPGYTVLAEAGRLGYFAATVLLVLVLAGGAILTRGRDAKAWSATAGVMSFGVVAAMAAADGVDAAVLAAVSLAAVLLTAPWAAAQVRHTGVAALALFAGAFTLAALFALGQGMHSGALLQTDLLLAAESLALAFGIAAPLLTGRGDRVAVGVAAAAGLLVFGALLGNESTSKTLALWSVGLAGYFPAVLYGGAAAGLTYAIVTAWRTRRRALAVGLVLVLLGGIGLHSTYQTGLVLAGLLALGSGQPAPAERRAEPGLLPSG